MFLAGIILLSGFLRLYRLRDTLIFLGDQGRDAMVARAIFKEGDPALIGPVTSAGNMYLGPLYYYLMVPSLAVTYPDPTGPAYLVAIFGIFTVGLVYYVTREMFGRMPAVIASLIYSILDIAIVHSRFSWNPNPAPLFGLIVFYTTYMAIVTKNYRWFVGAFFSYAVLTQLHYIALLMGGVIGVGLWLSWVAKKDRVEWAKWVGMGILILALSFLPLIIFDIRHGLTNWQALVKFLVGGEEQIRGVNKLGEVVKEIEGRTFRVIAQVLGTNQGWPDRMAAYTPLVGLVYLVTRLKMSKSRKIAVILLATWLLVAIVGISFYSSSVFGHYLSYLFTAPAILVGVVGGWLIKRSKLWLGPVGLFVGWIMAINLQSPVAFANISPHVDDIWAVSRSILARVDMGEKYNIVSIAEGGDIEAQNYRYFLMTSDTPPVEIEDRGSVEKLFIIREVVDDKRVVDSPVYEIVVFPNKEPVEVYTEGTTEVTVLQRNEE